MGEILTFEPTAEQFGVLWKYLQLPDVTDVDYNGRELWITDLRRGRYRAKEQLTEEFIHTFTHNISNCVNKQFNHANKILEADTKELRIDIISRFGDGVRYQHLHPKIPLHGARQHCAYARGRLCAGGDVKASDQLRAGRDEFCVWRRAGSRKDRVRQVFYAVYPKVRACDYHRGFL